jgi:hypothetical protein
VFDIVRRERAKPHARIRSLRVAMDAIEKIYAVMVRAELESRSFQRDGCKQTFRFLPRHGVCIFGGRPARDTVFPGFRLGSTSNRNANRLPPRRRSSHGETIESRSLRLKKDGPKKGSRTRDLRVISTTH